MANIPSPIVTGGNRQDRQPFMQQLLMALISQAPETIFGALQERRLGREETRKTQETQATGDASKAILQALLQSGGLGVEGASALNAVGGQVTPQVLRPGVSQMMPAGGDLAGQVPGFQQGGFNLPGQADLSGVSSQAATALLPMLQQSQRQITETRAIAGQEKRAAEREPITIESIREETEASRSRTRLSDLQAYQEETLFPLKQEQMAATLALTQAQAEGQRVETTNAQKLSTKLDREALEADREFSLKYIQFQRAGFQEQMKVVANTHPGIKPIQARILASHAWFGTSEPPTDAELRAKAADLSAKGVNVLEDAKQGAVNILGLSPEAIKRADELLVRNGGSPQTAYDTAVKAGMTEDELSQLVIYYTRITGEGIDLKDKKGRLNIAAILRPLTDPQIPDVNILEMLQKIPAPRTPPPQSLLQQLQVK